MIQSMQNKKPFVFSPAEVRQIIGILGMIFPFILSFGAWIIFQEGIQSSISSYYYTGMRNVFVGFLCVIGFFLLSYKGYQQSIDNIVANLGCLFAVGVALFPTAPKYNPTPTQSLIGTFHYIFAAFFFIALICFALLLFTKTDQSKPTPQKIKRNRIYIICGTIMIVCIILIAVYSVFKPIKEIFKPSNPVFWLESLAVIAFGAAWFTKSETWILKDKVEAD
jgi:hypothetical protein